VSSGRFMVIVWGRTMELVPGGRAS
jgi:hypothetical protein